MGAGPAGAFSVAVTLRGSFQFDGLAPGATVTANFDCVQDVSATVDPDSRVQEADETNNTRTYASVCITSPVVQLGPAGFTP